MTTKNSGPLTDLDLAMEKVAVAKRNLEFARAYSSNWPEAEYQAVIQARSELNALRAARDSRFEADGGAGRALAEGAHEGAAQNL